MSAADESPLVTGAVLAGGVSRRMGIDKRAQPVDGVPMLRRAALAVAAVSTELVVACRRDTIPDAHLLEGLGARLVFDRLEDAGPLAGLEAALAAARCELVLVVAADMPWLEPAVLARLVATARADPQADVVALATEHGLEKLLAVYRRRALPEVTRMLDGEGRKMGDLLARLRVRALEPDEWRPLDPSGRTPGNVNRPSDLMPEAAAADDRANGPA